MLAAIIVFGLVLIPMIMSWIALSWTRLNLAFDMMAVLSAIVSFSSAAEAVCTVIKNSTVFMTSIHGLFLNPFFMISSGYLGVYVIYALYLVCFRQLKTPPK